MQEIDRNRRPQEPVLIVEDREENRALLQGILNQLKIDSKIAENGQIGLEMVAKESFSVFIVDLMMPVMDGHSFIKALKDKDPEAIILVQTALDNTETIIEIMKKGVYDYIIKPIDPDLFARVISKALEYKYLRDIEKHIQKMESNKLRSQLEWLNYKESIRKSGSDSHEKNSIENLKTSLSQGSGFGAMTSIVDMIQSTAAKNPDGSLVIDGEIMDLLFENSEITKNMLKGLGYVSELLDSEIVTKRTEGSTLVEKIPEFCKEINSYLKLKNIKINYPKLSTSCIINVDIDKIGMAIEELVINAFKYCNENSNIDIFAHINNGYLIVSVKNEVKNDSYGGIDESKEKYVIQPFYRIHPPVESVNKIEKFGLGLGLTMVDHILGKHSGLFFIHNAKDHTTKTITLCVLSEIFLPLQ
ncbi:MAG: response regulator [Leptospiraceae bacterium]|nr:response regulator [Leptospiraceae bacterium]